MSRYIDADLLKDKTTRVNNIWNVTTNAEGKGLDEIIDDIPPADVRENVRAHWIDMKPTGDSRFMCSRCKGKEKVPTIMGEPIVWDYCPNCGADMRGDNP